MCIQVILYWLKLTLPVHLHITYFTYWVYLDILEAMLIEISNTVLTSDFTQWCDFEQSPDLASLESVAHKASTLHSPPPPPTLPRPWHKFLLSPMTPILPPLSPFLPHIILWHQKNSLAFIRNPRQSHDMMMSCPHTQDMSKPCPASPLRCYTYPFTSA